MLLLSMLEKAISGSSVVALRALVVVLLPTARMALLPARLWVKVLLGP
jgi:hypothetical protein